MQSQLASGPTASARVVSPPIGRLDDERLARLVGEGSTSAFSLLYERHHQQLYRYCRSILRDETDARDALQSALERALAALQRGQRNAPLRPWLFRIAHNEAISLLRRRPAYAEPGRSEESAGGSLEEQAESRQRLAQLVADLQELPERQRAALVMHELSGLSHAEIAVALETTPRASKQSIFDARQALSEFAEGRAMACEKVQRAISDGDGRALRARRLRAHMRDCAACAAFAAAIPARTAELRMLAPPLAPAAAGALLAQLTHAGGAHGALGASAAHGGAGAFGGVASAGAGKTISAAVAVKALAGAAIVASVAAGAASVLPSRAHHALSPHAPGHSTSGRSDRDTSRGGASTGRTSHSRPAADAIRGRSQSTSGAARDAREAPAASESARSVAHDRSRSHYAPAAAKRGQDRAASRRSSGHSKTRRASGGRASGSGRGSVHVLRPPARPPAHSGPAAPNPASATGQSGERAPRVEGVLAPSPAPERPSSTHASPPQTIQPGPK
jgi:RNA polymerase sigma factor (sigma-70 family)